MYGRSRRACIWCTRTPARLAPARSISSRSVAGSPLASGTMMSPLRPMCSITLSAGVATTTGREGVDSIISDDPRSSADRRTPLDTLPVERRGAHEASATYCGDLEDHPLMPALEQWVRVRKLVLPKDPVQVSADDDTPRTLVRRVD